MWKSSPAARHDVCVRDTAAKHEVHVEAQGNHITSPQPTPGKQHSSRKLQGGLWVPTTGPPNHPSLSLSQDGHDIHTMPQHSTEPTPHAGLGALGTNLVVQQIDVRDRLVFLQRLGQGLEAATDQGWRLDFSALPSNPDHSNPENT